MEKNPQADAEHGTADEATEERADDAEQQRDEPAASLVARKGSPSR